MEVAAVSLHVFPDKPEIGTSVDEVPQTVVLVKMAHYQTELVALRS
jgi:hypothetical protein